MVRYNNRGANWQRFIPCRQLISEGACLTENCPFAHSLEMCDLCGVLSSNKWNHKSHVNGKKHKLAVQNAARNQDLIASPSSASTPPLLDLSCAVCAQTFSTSDQLAAHFKSPKHVTKDRFAKYIETKRIAEAGREGLVLTPLELDFGLVEFDSLPARGPARSKYLTATIEREGYSYDLQEISLRSEVRTGRRAK